jgi:tetratricopeptide (TPR) repeat protein
MRRALAFDEKSYGSEHPEVATDLNNLGEVLTASNRLAEAEPLYRRALGIWEKSFGLEHPTVGIALAHLASLQAERGNWTEAAALRRRAKPILTAHRTERTHPSKMNNCPSTSIARMNSIRHCLVSSPISSKASIC